MWTIVAASGGDGLGVSSGGVMGLLGGFGVVGWLLVFVLGVFALAAVCILAASRTPKVPQFLKALDGHPDDAELFVSDMREKALVELPRTRGLNFCYYLDETQSAVTGQTAVFATGDPDTARALFMNRAHASIRHPRYLQARKIPGLDGILFMDGDVWKSHHRALMPVFQGSNYGAFAGRMYDAVLAEVDTWKDGSLVDAHTAMFALTYRILFEAGFGINADPLTMTPLSKKLFDILYDFDPKREMGGPSDNGNVSKATLVMKFIVGLFSLWRKSGRINAALQDVLDERKKDPSVILRYPKTTNSEKDQAERDLLEGRTTTDFARSTPHGTAAAAESKAPEASKTAAKTDDKLLSTDFLQGMVDAKFSLKEIGNELGHIRGAYKAVGVVSALALMELARKPKWVDELRREHRRVLASRPGPHYLTREDVTPGRCPVTFAVIKEATRYHPISMGIMRVTGIEMTVKAKDGSSVAIPPGTPTIILIHALHHNPDFWDKPEEFNPGRWLERAESPAPGASEWVPKNDFKPRVPFSYVPFMEGMRQCLGRKLVELEMATLFHVVFANVDITVPKGYHYRVKADFYPDPIEPIKLHVKRLAKPGVAK